MNYTWAGRLHIVVRPGLRYLTLWFWGRRYHWCNGRLYLPPHPAERGWP